MKYSLPLILTTMIGISANAYAASSDVTPSSEHSQIQYYMGLQFGQSTALNIPDPVVYLKTVDTLPEPLHLNIGLTQRTAMAYRIFGGALFYTTGKWTMGAELGYVSLGEVKYYFNSERSPYPGQAKDINVTANDKGFDVLGVLNYNINPVFSLMSKLGFAYLSQTVSSDSDGLGQAGVSTTSTAISPELTLGLSAHLTHNFALQLTDTYFSGGTPPNSVTKVEDMKTIPSFNFYSLGAVYKF